MNYTKGEWKIYQDNMAGITSIVSEDGVGFFQNTIATLNRKDSNYQEAASILAASKDMYEALKIAAGTLEDCGYYEDSTVVGLAKKALTKAEGK